MDNTINQPPVPAPETPVELPQKISLVWVLIGIAGILLMWFISSKVF